MVSGELPLENFSKYISPGESPLINLSRRIAHPDSIIMKRPRLNIKFIRHKYTAFSFLNIK